MSNLYTPRLILRSFVPADAARVQYLAGDFRVASMTALIPHPYPDGAAENWIVSLADAQRERREFTFALTLAGTRSPGRELDPSDTGHVIGAMGVLPMPADPARGVLGYWIGTPYWNKGFATEAARAVLDFAFKNCGYSHVVANHLAENPASGRVMQKVGMVETGASKDFFRAKDVSVDLVHYALSREQWARRQVVQRWKPAGPAMTLT